jgi:hypothetical protein
MENEQRVPEARRGRVQVPSAHRRFSQRAPNEDTPATHACGGGPGKGTPDGRAILRRLAARAAETGEHRAAVQISACALILGGCPAQRGEVCVDLSRIAAEMRDAKIAAALADVRGLIELAEDV